MTWPNFQHEASPGKDETCIAMDSPKPRLHLSIVLATNTAIAPIFSRILRNSLNSSSNTNRVAAIIMSSPQASGFDKSLDGRLSLGNRALRGFD